MSEALEFYAAVLKIETPNYRKHEVQAITKLIPAQDFDELTKPTRQMFRLKSEAFKNCELYQFAEHLNRIGIQDVLAKLRWINRRAYQHFSTPFETATNDARRITKYTFRGFKVFLEIATSSRERR